MRNYDLVFLKKFSMVIGFLSVVTLALILAALYLNGVLPAERDPAMNRVTEQRIAPQGAVYAGQTGAAQQAAAAAAAAAA
ncbi:MAG TPA: cytochrome c5 family protein, partial [Lysobacter sp.]